MPNDDSPRTPSVVVVTAYDLLTGEVREKVTTSAANLGVLEENLLADGLGVAIGEVPFHHLIDTKTGRDLGPAPPLSYTVEANTISGLPAGTQAVVNGCFRVNEEDGKIILNASWPSEVKVSLSHPLFQNTDLVVRVEPLQFVKTGVIVPQKYDHLRAVAYKSIPDQLDLIIKGLSKLPAARGIEEFEELINMSRTVKETFVKPTE